MKTKIVGYCVATKGKNGFKADALTVDTSREEAIKNYLWDKKSYQMRKRRGEVKTIPVYVCVDDLKA